MAAELALSYISTMFAVERRNPVFMLERATFS
jgi:hypothetical protein